MPRYQCRAFSSVIKPDRLFVRGTPLSSRGVPSYIDLQARSHILISQRACSSSSPKQNSTVCLKKPVTRTQPLQTSQQIRLVSNSRRRSGSSQQVDGEQNPPDSDSITSSVEQDSEMDTYDKLFNNNSHWRRSLAESNPDLFESLSKGQSPQILWIGCADSRCPETTILGLQPGEIFCHRNIANILVPTDINSLSVIQFAVQYLKVKHIIICGHTSCGGIAAALDNKKLGLIDTWLMPLRSIRQNNLKLLDSLNEKERALKMVELNVRHGLGVLLENPIVIDAVAERGLKVHGLIYNVGTGELQELDIEEDEAVVNGRVTAFKTA